MQQAPLKKTYMGDTWKYRGEPMVISIDFDGTCVESDYPNAAVSKPGCVETIKRLVDLGHRVIIWTCREIDHEKVYGKHGGLNEVFTWLAANGLSGRVTVNDNTRQWIEDMGGVNSRKIFAHVYIDDRNLGGFPGWDKVMSTLGIEG
jgi:hypothetical protein